MCEDNKKHRKEMFKQSNAAAIAYSEKAIIYAFYLNGGAATALLARAQESFYPAATSFAIGALWAVLCIGFSYAYQMLITRTWEPDLPPENIAFDFFLKITISCSTVEKMRSIPILAWILSIFQFVKGVWQI